MGRGTGDRAVSEVVGFILVFGMLVTAFTVYQGIVVPEQNRQVEFQHNQDVQGQMQDLRNAIVATAGSDSGESVSVTLGATYPRRAIAMNLGVSAGALETVEAGGGDVHLDNAVAIDDETREYLTGNRRTFATKAIQYRPVYSFYAGAPVTVYENALLYNQFAGANVTLTDQVVVDDRRITLIAVNGSVSQARADTVSVSTRAISTSSTRVSVTNATGERVNVTVPTRLGVTRWEEVLEDELAANGGFVEAVEPVPGRDAVKIVLRQGVTYDLRLAKVGVGGAVTGEPAKYVTDVSGDGSSVPEGGRQTLVVEVRDRFNNPVSNVTLTLANSPSHGTVTPGSLTTDSDGRATFTYTAVDDVDQLQADAVDFEFDGGPTANESVTFDVDVLDSEGSGGGGGSTGSYSLSWLDPSATGDNAGETFDGCTATECTWEADSAGDTLTLRGQSSPALEGVDVDFAVNDSSVGSINPETGETDSAGEATTALQANANGTVSVYLTGDADADRINVTVVVPGEPGPPGAFAYDDADGDEEYDSGETTYSNADLANGFDDDTVDLVVPFDVGTIDSGGDPVQITANSIVSDVDFTSDGDNVELTADGDIDVAGQTVESGGGDVEITAGGELDATGATLSSQDDNIVLGSQGDMRLESATIDAQNGEATADLTQGSRTLFVDQAVIDDSDQDLVYDPNGITIDGSPASGSVSAN